MPALQTIARSLAPLFVMLATVAPAAAETGGDAARGARIYDRCIACHSLTRNRTGPRHCGLFGRRAGGVPGFAYSRAMATSGVIWGNESLDRFLEAPLKALPGTKMGYAGVKDPQDRADLIAYLRSAAEGSDLCR